MTPKRFLFTTANTGIAAIVPATSAAEAAQIFFQVSEGQSYEEIFELTSVTADVARQFEQDVQPEVRIFNSFEEMMQHVLNRAGDQAEPMNQEAEQASDQGPEFDMLGAMQEMENALQEALEHHEQEDQIALARAEGFCLAGGFCWECLTDSQRSAIVEVLNRAQSLPH